MPGILSTTLKTIKDQIPKKKQPWDLMVIPFAKEPPKYVSKEDRLTFKLRSTPNDADSITYEVKSYAFDDGSPEEWLEHIKTFRKILKGQNITTGEPAFAMLKRLLKGKALTDFGRIFTDESYTNTMPNVKAMIGKLTTNLFPERALQKQRRGLRRYIKKPLDMRTSSFYARLVEMNEQLEHFPGGDATSKLGDDELIEILEFSLPKTWRMHMTLSRFICTEKSVKEILDFCKEIEGLEAEHGSLSVVGVPDPRPKSTTSSGTKRKRERTVKFSDEPAPNKGQKYCPIHGHCSHSAAECTLLKSAIANGKKQYLDKKNSYKNRSTNRDKSNFSKQEVNVMISSACEQAVNRALKVHTSVTSKRRRMHLHTKTVDETTAEKDIQQQVEQLKLYRDNKEEGETETSSSSSEDSS